MLHRITFAAESIRKKANYVLDRKGAGAIRPLTSIAATSCEGQNRMLLEKIRNPRAASGTDECNALQQGIAEAQATIKEAAGSDNADLRATLNAFIAKAEQRIADIRRITGR